MGDLAQFSRELDAFERQVQDEVSDVSVSAAVILFAKIVSRTPYRTGRARSSWQISIGQPNRAMNVEGQYPQYADPMAAYMLAVAEAQRILSKYRSHIFNKPSIWITNKLRYVVFLERGTSKMKPAAMVQLSVAEVNAQFGHVTRATV